MKEKRFWWWYFNPEHVYSFCEQEDKKVIKTKRNKKCQEISCLRP